MVNPFFFGNPVPVEKFINREKIILRLMSRIRDQGQSTAVVGALGSGKTSLLQYIAHDSNRSSFGFRASQFLFQSIDIQGLDQSFTRDEFWQEALRPFVAKVINTTLSDARLQAAYRQCQDNRFDTFTMKELLKQMKQAGWRLILLLDEFDGVLHHPRLNSAEFLGSLRTLASLSEGALALIIASRQSLTTLNEHTKMFSLTTSPYFNFMREEVLEPFSLQGVNKLLSLTAYFHYTDRQYIYNISGGHPYLAQAAASTLWELYEQGETEMAKRLHLTGQTILELATRIIIASWAIWSSETRIFFIITALIHMAYLNRQFNNTQEQSIRVSYFLNVLTDLKPESRLLEQQGFIIKDTQIPGEYRIRPAAFLWWVADEVVPPLRTETAFAAWLRDNKLQGILSRETEERLGQAIHIMGDILTDGVITLVKAAIQEAVQDSTS